jgi:hypothetical protein
MNALSQAVIEKLQSLSPEDLRAVLRYVDTLAPAEGNGAANAEDDAPRPWRGTFAVETPRRDETPLSLPAEPVTRSDRPFDILWDARRHDD